MASRASKNLIYGIIGGVKNYFKNQKELTNQAVSEMNHRYPQGWSQSPLHMMDLMKIRKGLKNK